MFWLNERVFESLVRGNFRPPFRVLYMFVSETNAFLNFISHSFYNGMVSCEMTRSRRLLAGWLAGLVQVAVSLHRRRREMDIFPSFFRRSFVLSKPDATAAAAAAMKVVLAASVPPPLVAIGRWRATTHASQAADCVLHAPARRQA